MVNKFKNKKIIVTGGTGFIGGHLVEALLGLGARIVVIDIVLNPKSYFAKNNLSKKVNLEFVDITNRKRILNVFKKYNPDYVFHLAAKTIVQDSFHEPWETFSTNIMGTVNILEASRFAKNLKAIIIASSDKAYGKLLKNKYVEKDALTGDHPYDVSKSATDLISSTYFATYGLPVIITRFGNVYGEGDLNDSRIIPDIMECIIKHKILKIRSNGQYIRDYIYVKDVISGYLLVAAKVEQTKGEAYNFGSKDTLSVFKIIEKIEGKLNLKIRYTIMNNSQNEIPYQSLNYSKIKQLGWSPKFNMNKIIKQIYEYYLNI